MDDDSGRAPRGSRPAGQGGQRNGSGANPGSQGAARPNSGPRGGGLLSQFGRPAEDAAGDEQGAAPRGARDRRQGASGPGPGGLALPSRQKPQKGLRGALDALTGQARRLGGSLRRGSDGPRAGEWKATDFDPHTLREWDEEDAAPFELPPDPDAELVQSRRAQAMGRGGPRGSGRGSPRGWEDDNWDAGWETGTWDTGWATGSRRSVDYARSDQRDEFSDSGFWTPGPGRAYADDALSQSLATLAALAALTRPICRI